MDLTWHDLHHAELTVADLHDVLALRNRVFVVEQSCCYQDVDGLDLVRDTRHLLARAAARPAARRRGRPRSGGAAPAERSSATRGCWRRTTAGRRGSAGSS